MAIAVYVDLFFVCDNLTANGSNVTESYREKSDDCENGVIHMNKTGLEVTMSTNSCTSIEDEQDVILKQCFQLKIFYKESSEADAWIIEQEKFITQFRFDTPDTIDIFMKKGLEYESLIAEEDKKIKALEEFADNLINIYHYATGDIAERRASLLERRLILMSKRIQMLHEFDILRQFRTDCDAIQLRISQNLKTAMKEGIVDQLIFNSEMNATQSKIDKIIINGQKLLENNHTASSIIRTRMAELLDLRKALVELTDKITAKFFAEEIVHQMENYEKWLTSVEGQLLSEDSENNVSTLKELIEKHALLEADVESHQLKIDGLILQAKTIMEGDFDATTIKIKEISLVNRVSSLQIKVRRRLQDSLQVQEFYYEIDEEIRWINEKESIAASTDRGNNLMEVIKIHQAALDDIYNNERRLKYVCESGRKMLEKGVFTAEIKKRLDIVNEKWKSLKDSAEKTMQELENSLKYLLHFKANEEELPAHEFEKDQDSTEALRTLYETLMINLEKFSSSIFSLKEQEQSCKTLLAESVKALNEMKQNLYTVKGNYEAKMIHLKGVNKKLVENIRRLQQVQLQLLWP